MGSSTTASAVDESSGEGQPGDCTRTSPLLPVVSEPVAMIWVTAVTNRWTKTTDGWNDGSAGGSPAPRNWPAWLPSGNGTAWGAAARVSYHRDAASGSTTDTRYCICSHPAVISHWASVSSAGTNCQNKHQGQQGNRIAIFGSLVRHTRLPSYRRSPVSSAWNRQFRYRCLGSAASGLRLSPE